MLLLSNVEVMYSNVILVLKGVSLEVRDGQIVVLLGANGAGKITTLKAVSGLLYSEAGRVTDGDIAFEGTSIRGISAHKIVDRGIVQVQEGRRDAGLRPRLLPAGHRGFRSPVRGRGVFKPAAEGACPAKIKRSPMNHSG
jgi:branched-chain amino acid transport system ATP-binding protein